MYRRFLRRNKIRRLFDLEEESIYNKPGYIYVPYIIVSTTGILHSSNNINKKIKSRYNLC